jgi:hypothetical protein
MIRAIVFKPRVQTIALVAGVLIVAVVGGAFAATGVGSHSTITACVHHKGGGLYEAHKCGRHDAKLKWNATGSPGLAGRAGSAGAPGVTGEQGVAGADGATGSAGATGAEGSTGPTGRAGATGSAGTTGATGLGATGGTGAAGSAIAYGYFESGTTIMSFDKNIASVTNPSAGTYCITLDASVASGAPLPVVSPEWESSTDGSGSNANFVLAYVDDQPSAIGCGSATDSVITEEVSGTTVTFHNEGFTFSVP